MSPWFQTHPFKQGRKNEKTAAGHGFNASLATFRLRTRSRTCGNAARGTDPFHRAPGNSGRELWPIGSGATTSSGKKTS